NPRPSRTVQDLLEFRDVSNDRESGELVDEPRFVEQLIIRDLGTEKGIECVITLYPGVEIKDVRDAGENDISRPEAILDKESRTPVIVAISIQASHHLRRVAGAGQLVFPHNRLVALKEEQPQEGDTSRVRCQPRADRISGAP